jgi:hypothetical protein
MKKSKKFDCVQMKWDIQQRIQKEYKGLPKQEAHKKQMEQVNKNPILGPFLKRVRSTHKSLIK